MRIDMNRKPLGSDPSSINPAFDPNWSKRPRCQRRWDGEKVDVEVIHAFTQWSRPSKKNISYEELVLELGLDNGTRLTVRLRGDGKQTNEDGSVTDVPSMRAETLGFGKLAQHMNPKAFEGIEGMYFDSAVTYLPWLIGMRFVADIYTYHVYTNQNGDPVNLNNIEFFDAKTMCTYDELIQNQPAKRVNETLAYFTKKAQKDKEKAEAMAKYYQPQPTANGYGAMSLEKPISYADAKAGDDDIPF